MKPWHPYKRKHVWSESEDNQLAKLISQYGVNGSWSIIALEMDSRNGKQCRERYVNHLNPDIKRTPWLPEEDVMIEQLYAEWGSQWSRFMEKLPGRSDNAIKNRWHLLKRASKLAAKMQSSNPSVETSSSFVPSSCVDEDQSMKQSSEGSLFHDIKACSKSIDDDAESSSKRTCRRECDSYNSEGMEVECSRDESLHEWLLDTLSDPRMRQITSSVVLCETTGTPVILRQDDT